MTYKYSICYPDRENIEYPDKTLDKSEVLDIVKSYPWVEQIKLMNSLPEGEVCYSPSLDFTHINTKRSFCLSAYEENEKLLFSLWYKRPKKVKPFFGLLRERIVEKVIDKWSFDFEIAYKHLETFLNGDFRKIENIMNE